MTEEKENETNSRHDARQRRARNFKFEIGANNAAEQKQWRQRRDPKSELLKTGRL
jgi:hypothetical protein